MTQVIRVSKQGKDVLTETDRNNLIVDSAENTFKILYTGTASITVTAATRYKIAHNSPLPAATSMLVMVKFPDGSVTMPSWNNTTSVSKDGTYAVSQWCFDNTYFYFNCVAGSSYTLAVSWLIFEPQL